MGIVRGLITLMLLLSFLTMVAWVFSGRHKRHFDAAARLPLEDDPGRADAAQRQIKVARNDSTTDL